MNKILGKWSLLIIFMVWFIFACPFFLKGKVPFPSTYLATNYGPWNAYDLYQGPVKNQATPDVITQIFPWKKLVIDNLKSGKIPLWNPYVFSGTPLLANYQSAALSPLNLLYFILPFIDAWSIQVLLAPLFAGIFMHLFVRSLNVSDEGSVISSIAFMFCGFITTWLMYGTLSYAIAFLPLALFAIEKFEQSRKWYFLTILSISIPLSFLSGHFQTSIYFLLFIISYALFKLFLKKNIQIIFLTFSSIFFGLLLAGPQLLPSIELYLNSVRSGLFMKTEVIPWAYLPTFIAPDIFGNPVTRNAWFGHYAEWNAYIGFIPLILGFYSLRKKSSVVLFFFCASAVVLMLAFQTPILDLLIALKVPVLSTSAASRIIVLFSFSFAVLAGFGFDNLMVDIREKRIKYIVALLNCFIVIFAGIWGIVLAKLFIPENWVSVAVSNLKLPSLVFVIFIAFIFLINIIPNKKRTAIFSVLVILLVVFDLLRFATKWQPFESRDLVYSDVPISGFLKNISGSSRVFGSVGQEVSMIYRLTGLEGYDPLYIGRYGEFLNAAKDGYLHQAERSVAQLSKNGEFTGKIINLLGVKYIIHKVSDGHAVWAFPFWDYPVDQFRFIYQDDKYQILENKKAFPRAFLVRNYNVTMDKRKMLSEIFRSDIDLSNDVVVEEDPAIHLTGEGSVSIKNYGSNKIEIETNSNGNSILVLTDPYYPGWKSFVDKTPAKILRADYAFRGVVVPRGTHNVEFIYDPDSFKAGVILGVLGLLGMLGEGFYLWKRSRS